MKEPPTVPVRIIAGLTALNGLFAIAEVILVRFPRRIEATLPFNFEVLTRSAALLSGFVLLYISWRLLARKRRAWQIASIASLVIVVGHMLYARNLGSVIIAGLSLLILALYRNEFIVASEPISIRQALVVLGASIVLAVSYGTIGFSILSERDFHQTFSFGASIIRTLREYSLMGNADLIPYTRQATWFLDSLDLFGVVTTSVGVLSLFRPLAYRYATIPAERQRARMIVDEYGRDSEDEFKLWPEDKAYFFTASGRSVVAYRVTAGTALVLGEPIGPDDEREAIITGFAAYAHRHGWLVGYLYVPSTNLAIFERLGFASFMVGQDAIVATAAFVTTTIRSKHFRAIMNKFERLGYRFEVRAAPQSTVLLRQTRRISDLWLKQPGRVERGFALGYYDRSYIERSPLALVYDADGKLIAFANLIDSRDEDRASIDLMRYLPGCESGAMDYLLASLIRWLHAQGTAELSLGLAPLAGLSGEGERNMAERIVGRISRYDIGTFSFEGLRRFKSKFEPIWEDRYLVYERSLGSLGVMAYAIDQTMKRRDTDIDKLTNN